MDQQKTVELLKRSPLFATLSDKYLKAVAKEAKQETFAPGGVIIQEGAAGASAFYMVLDGAVEVKQSGKVVNTIGSGSYFGEAALLAEAGAKRTADVVAMRETTCLVLPRWNFQAMLKTHPEMALNILGALASRLSGTHEALKD